MDEVDFHNPSKERMNLRLSPGNLRFDNPVSASVPSTPGQDPEASHPKRTRRTSFSRLSNEHPSPSTPIRLTEAEQFEQATDFIVREFMANRLRKAGLLDSFLFVPGSAKRSTPVSAPTAKEPNGLQNRSPNSNQVGRPLQLEVDGNSPALPFLQSPRKADLNSPRSPCSLKNGKALEKVTKALIDLGDQFDERYRETFAEVPPVDWLNIENMNDVRDKFFTISRDLYFGNAAGRHDAGRNLLDDNQIKWGRIVAHFTFSSHLAYTAVSTNHEELATALASWLTTFTTRYLKRWIERNGGWEGLVAYYETLNMRKTWNSKVSNFAAGVGAGLAIAAVAICAKKYLPVRI